jgi:hypothetical protein
MNGEISTQAYYDMTQLVVGAIQKNASGYLHRGSLKDVEAVEQALENAR